MSKSVKQTSRAMSAPVSEKTLKADLETYQQKALEFGATDASIVPAGWAQVDERVRLKCAIPPCPNYNRCANCPPYTPEPEFVRKALARYGWAILFKHDVIPVEDFADVGRYYPHGRNHQRKTDEIAARIESQAFADGYRFALGLGAGGCRDSLCDGGLCQMLDSGRCPHILRARPSIEAMGIDVSDLANRVGWEIYPILRRADARPLPSAVSIGLVFIH